MKIGEWNTLRIDRFTPPGAFLLDEDGNDVLLPNKYVQPDFIEEQEINVFIYKDSEDRIVATLRKPFIELNQFAYLKVIEVNPFGAFLDWGLEKDLLVPFVEQPKNMEEGHSYLVYMYLDEASQRLAATARVQPFYESAVDVFEKGEAVQLLIGNATDLGFNVIVNHKYRGLIFQSDIHRRIYTGEQTTGFIKNVREDGKLDVVFVPEGYEKVEPLARKMLQILQENGGFIALNDKSDPLLIQKKTGWSKKTFKQIVGNLYKQRLIVIHENGIALAE